MHCHRHKTWGEAAGLPETAIRLDRLPDGVDFANDFPEPISFDARRKRLVYRGFMTSSSYRFLHGLSQDIAYLDALDYLYQQSAYTHPDAAAEGRSWWWLCGATFVGAGAAVAWLLTRH